VRAIYIEAIYPNVMAVAQQLNVVVGVAMICGVAALPLYFKSVREKEMVVARAR
jgi:hypothetical protein